MRIIINLTALLMLVGCNREPPGPSIAKNPITIEVVPHNFATVREHWKMGWYTVGHRFLGDEYVITTGRGGLYGHTGQAFSGPGTVNSNLMKSFEPIMELAKKANANGEKVVIQGDLLLSEWEWPTGTTHKIVILHSIKYKDQELLAIRNRP